LRVINYLEYTPGIPLALIGTASAACDARIGLTASHRNRRPCGTWWGYDSHSPRSGIFVP